MAEYRTKKLLLGIIISFILTLLIFLLELESFRNTVFQYNNTIRQIAINDASSFFHELQFFTDNKSRYFIDKASIGDDRLIRSIANQNPRISEILLLNAEKRVVTSLHGKTGYLFEMPPNHIKYENNTYGVIRDDHIRQIVVTSAIREGTQQVCYLTIYFSTNDFEKEFLRKYSTDKFKVAILDEKENPLVWPFEQTSLLEFQPGQDRFQSHEVEYDTYVSGLEDTPLKLYFFFRDIDLGLYLIIPLVIFLFGLCFYTYRYATEMIKNHNFNLFFDDVDFSRLNALDIGILVTNQSEKVVFANEAAHSLFPEKKIHKTTPLNDVIPGLGNTNTKITLKKSDNLLEIISFPYLKNGDFLGSIIGIHSCTEKTKLCAQLMEQILELVPYGVMFLDRENNILTTNPTARSRFSGVKKGSHISEYHPALAALIEHNTGTGSPSETTLSLDHISCELVTINDENNLNAGTLVIIKEQPWSSV